MVDTSFGTRQIGLGTFPFSNVFTPVAEDEATRIVEAFLDAGGRYIETAPVYPVAQANLGKILRQFPRESYLIGTKCGFFPDGAGKPQPLGAPAEVRQQVHAELRRLGVERLDLVEFHVTPQDVSPSEAMGGLEALKAEGLVGEVGVSNATTADLEAYLRGGTPRIVQNRYSIVHRREVQAIRGLCQRHSIEVSPYQVIERGQLLGSRIGRRDGDLRNKKSEYIGDADERVRAWSRDVLGEIASSAGLSLLQLAVRWCFSDDTVVLPVVGATSVGQVRELLSVPVTPLPPDLYRSVEQAVASLETDVRRLFGVGLSEYRGLA